jgi:acyl-CoA reductase-like NAD-dependent aldehyde dehydrogenase
VTLTVVDPATEGPLAELEQAGVEEADEAVARAKAAYPAWRAVAPADRARLLRGLAGLVEDNAEELARIGAFIEATAKVKVGNPADEATEMGPLISAEHRAKVASYLTDAPSTFRGDDMPYGLSGSIWTRDGARALRVARAIEAGVLSVNANTSVRVQTPFGGFKQSGFGRELGMHALDGYSEVKSVFVSTEE